MRNQYLIVHVLWLNLHWNKINLFTVNDSKYDILTNTLNFVNFYYLFKVFSEWIIWWLFYCQCFWGKSRVKHSYGINNLKILEISRFNVLMFISVLKPNKSIQMSTERSWRHYKQRWTGWPSSQTFIWEEGESNSLTVSFLEQQQGRGWGRKLCCNLGTLKWVCLHLPVQLSEGKQNLSF